MKIFVVEDDEWFSKIIAYHLKQNPEYDIEVFHSGKEVEKHLNLYPDVVIIDYNLPDTKGDVLMKKIKEASPNTSCIVVSAQEDVQTAINLLKSGAYDYIVKNDDTNDRLWITLNNLKEKKELIHEVQVLQQAVKEKYDFSKIIKGNSKKIQQVFSLIEKAANSNINVSITGETGTGKELVAKAIHMNSSRNKKNFVAVNVAAIPSELIESELFGHEKGAFTGADKRRIGKFEEANNGTIFLDEIGEMDLNTQTKLLRVLQEREIVRIGDNQTIKLNIRIITATHKNLLDLVQEGKFREDLYYRIYGLPIELPPLRDRDNDIIILAKHFADSFCRDNGLNKKTFSTVAQEKILSYNYPGNVRELKAAIDLAALMSEGNIIEAENINFISNSSINNLLKKQMSLREYEITIVQHFLDKNNKNVIQTAKQLDVGKSTIYRMINNNEVTI